MEFHLYPHARDYIDRQGVEERKYIADEFYLFEQSTRFFLQKDGKLRSVGGYINLHRVAIGRHRFAGPIVDQKIHLVHGFLREGTPQEQAEFKSAAQKAKGVVVYGTNKKR